MRIRRASQALQRRSKTIMDKANEITSFAMARSIREQNGKNNKQAGDLSPPLPRAQRGGSRSKALVVEKTGPQTRHRLPMDQLA
jgi:hypothetical protein